jgi:hypothetical protein
VTLHRLIYASRLARTPFSHTGDEPDDECGRGLPSLLQGIVRASVPNNLRSGVNSMLIAHDGWFIQALEGPAEGVREIFERICRDDRHMSPVVLREGPVWPRAFGRWIMCAHAMTGSDAGILSRFGMLHRFDPVSDPTSPVLPLLIAVARENRTALDFQHEHLALLARRAA